MSVNAVDLKLYPQSSQPVNNSGEVGTSCKSEGSVFSDWLNDADKCCTDGKDDGKLSFKEGLTSFGKGLASIVKNVIKHPVAAGLSVAAGVALTVATGGAAAPFLVAAGATLGAGTIAYGGYKAVTADTDAEAKQAFETMGSGVTTLATSMLTSTKALASASKAGVEGATQALNGSTNILKSTLNCFKVSGEALKVSGANIITNARIALATVSNKGGVSYMSKPNEVQAYRFNPNGTSDEVLKNNPNVFITKDGKYAVPNKWNPDEPFLIDSSKEQMVMIYGDGDFAVCDGDIFKGSYVDTGAFKTSNAANYIDPKNLQYGQTIDATKQAGGSFRFASAGDEVSTLEGIRTVGKGDVIAVDVQGNDYVTPAANILKRNIAVSDASQKAFGLLNKGVVNTVKSDVSTNITDGLLALQDASDVEEAIN